MITLQSAYLNACLLELEALKPGNVHVFADGHGMHVQDFVVSAEHSAHALCQEHPTEVHTLGQRILSALQATHDQVGCNTNLGIILLCAPLVQARLQYPHDVLNLGLTQVLNQTTIQDAEQVFQGIRLVNPAGMGQRVQDDLQQPATIDLMAAMQQVRDTDSVARQYAEFYQDCWHAITLYEALVLRWQRPAWAATALYLYWLSHWPDSHIARKYGVATAQQVQAQAKQHYVLLLSQTNPKLRMGPLLAWDTQLKQAKLNPGTSADLTVATIFLSSLNKI